MLKEGAERLAQATANGVKRGAQKTARGAKKRVRRAKRKARRTPEDRQSQTTEAGVVREFTTEQEQVFYRVFSGKKEGGFVTAVKPRNRKFAREGLSLPESNKATKVQEVVVPRGGAESKDQEQLR